VPTKALPFARLWAAADVSRAGLDDEQRRGPASNERQTIAGEDVEEGRVKDEAKVM
jgi:hypothetical protein